MKKVLIAALISGVSFGAFAQQGGFQGPEAERSTVAQAKELKDDAWVILEGSIVKKWVMNVMSFVTIAGQLSRILMTAYGPGRMFLRKTK